MGGMAGRDPNATAEMEALALNAMLAGIRDAVFKGHESVVVQDIKISTDNVLFLKEKWYTASEGRTYLAPLPVGYESELGPGVHSTVPVMYFGLGSSEPKIAEFLGHVGLLIRDGQVSSVLITDQDEFHTLAATAQKLQVSFYAYIQGRVSGANQMHALADLIRERAPDFKPGDSWAPA